MSTIRTDLNNSQMQINADNLRRLQFGEVLTLLIRGLTATEAGVVPAANVATMAAAPVAVLQVNATAATVTGIKKLRVGPITGNGALVPATGEVVWPGGTSTKLLFAAADAVTACSLTYSKTTDLVSVLMASLEDISA